MKKEKTLYEKRISWHEEGISYNGEVFEEVPLTNGDKILREKDVKQLIKKILKNQFVKFDFSGSKEYRQGFLDGVKHMKNKIKQKAGFEDLKGIK